MSPGDLYSRHGKIYMILKLFESSWDFTSEDGMDHSQRNIIHVSCAGPAGMEEFPLEWFCWDAEAVND